MMWAFDMQIPLEETGVNLKFQWCCIECNVKNKN